MNLLQWLGRTLADDKGVPSVSRLAYLAFVLAGGFWLTFDLMVGLMSLKLRGIHSDWVIAFGVYASACTTGYVGAKLATRPSPRTTDANVSQ